MLSFKILLRHSFSLLQLLMGHIPQGNHPLRPPSNHTMHVPLNVTVQQASAQPLANDVHVSPCLLFLCSKRRGALQATQVSATDSVANVEVQMTCCEQGRTINSRIAVGEDMTAYSTGIDCSWRFLNNPQDGLNLGIENLVCCFTCHRHSSTE